ncbi:hypothetical protein L6164_026641 [Bauhinia variegata]|uniref:Uncharacterized protein n=1 Tax=Bauhinia variegata TaxID=167791 RepID=A0ACB9LQE8_BAUVA|nr:hypothetical protein L6164_026641 [Bauhinia variegata]
MEEGIVKRALSSLGKGFDLTSDFRLKFCKGEERLVLLNETERRELEVPGFGPIRDVSVDIKGDKGERTRHRSDILTFNQMSESFNQKSSIPGKIPSGLFNAMYGFAGDSWASDAANTKFLGFDGYFITLFNVRIDRYPLLLSKQVLEAVPSSWDPPALSRFIEKYGTHIIVGLSIGGADLALVKQDVSSNLEPSELKRNLDELGDQLFTGTCNFYPKPKEHKHKVPQAFDVFAPQNVSCINSSTSVCSKDGITVICSKRGGETQVSSHPEWLLTVPNKPDAVHFSFIPITSLLKAAPGRGFLSHAINLYLRYKPPISDLAYFLDFQVHKVWAPVHNDLPLGLTNRTSSSPSLTFKIMGPKLYVNTAKVTVDQRPVTGMRLFLEGMKCDRLAIHLQHLLNTPTMLVNKIEDTTIWSEDINDDRFFEAISGKNFSHICSAPVKYNPRWRSHGKDEAFIVTGAQLHVKKHDSKSVLHLRLLFSKVSNIVVVQSNWAHSPSECSQKSGIFSALVSTSISGKEKKPIVVVDSSVFPSGPPVPVQTQKLLKFVDMSQLCRGPQDSPGHWLVTGARLVLEKGKICLLVKFSLLNTTS